jgi:hypothetical protein
MTSCACRKKLDRRRYGPFHCSYQCWRRDHDQWLANIRRFRAEQAAEANPLSIQEQLDAGYGDVTEVDGQLVKNSEAVEDDPDVPVGTWQH